MTQAIRWAGFATWVVVALPTFAGAQASPRFPVWLAAWLVFGGASAVVSRRPRLDAAGVCGLVLQGAAVVVMVGLLCNGFVGLLLVVVAAELGRLAGLRLGIAWLVLQTLAAGAAIALHWSLRPALMLMPPYLGFELFTFLAFRVQARLAERSRLEERLRIARELHDALGHHLTALALNLEVAAHQTSGEAQENVRTAQALARLLLGDVRDLVHSMKEDGETDLAEGLSRLVRVVPLPEVHVDLPRGLTAKEPRGAHALLRCAQEFVTNSIRHGGARNVWIALKEKTGALEMTARDDGRGGSEFRAGDGLSGMRERLEELGGSLVIECGGEGFSLRATVPGRPVGAV
jgi:signal transduction histidine kinase